MPEQVKSDSDKRYWDLVWSPDYSYVNSKELPHLIGQVLVMVRFRFMKGLKHEQEICNRLQKSVKTVGKKIT